MSIRSLISLLSLCLIFSRCGSLPQNQAKPRVAKTNVAPSQTIHQKPTLPSSNQPTKAAVSLARKPPPKEVPCSPRNSLTKEDLKWSNSIQDLKSDDKPHDSDETRSDKDTPHSVNDAEIRPLPIPSPARRNIRSHRQRKSLENTRDSDQDCLTDSAEIRAGTDPNNPDTDADGWFDGPCNKRLSIILTKIISHDEQEDWGKDEFYLIADDIRYPNANLNDWNSFDDGDQRVYTTTIAQRVVGSLPHSTLALIHLEGWEDDPQATNNWLVDDKLFAFDIDLNTVSPGEVFSRRIRKSDWDYELFFRLKVDYFSDPNPTLASADTDKDGISEKNEAIVGRDFGGITDPTRPEILVELDHMSGHALSTQAKRLVTTQLHRHGYHLHLERQGTIPSRDCLVRQEAHDFYRQYFDYQSYNAFRYALMTRVLWNDASGVAIGDFFAIDDSTWWIEGRVLAQAGTLIHELGHTLGLNTKAHHRIDRTTWFAYDSAMNYFYQPSMVDYSSNGLGGKNMDHDDWVDVSAEYALQWSFGLSSRNNSGVCAD